MPIQSGTPIERVRELVQTFSADDADPAWLMCDRHPAANVAFTIVEPDGSSTAITFAELRERSERFAGVLRDLGVGLSLADSVRVDGRFRRALRQDMERRVVAGVAAGSEARGSENRFEFASADDGIDLRNVLLNLVAVALDQTAGDDDALRLAAILLLMLHHLEDGIDGLLLGGIDEAAGVDDDNLGVFSARRQLGSVVVQHAHHHLGVDEILGAAERDEPYFRAR